MQQLRVLLRRPSRVPCNLPGAVLLRGSVGYNGKNIRSDVMAIQASLNSVLPTLGGLASPLAQDGIAGSKTQNAILAFQTRWVPFRDSRVDPDGKTLRALNNAVGVHSITGSSYARGPTTSVRTGPHPPKPTPPVNPSVTAAIAKAENRLRRVKMEFLPAIYQATLCAARLCTRASRHASKLPFPGVARNDPDRLAFLLIAKHFKLHEEHPQAAVAGVQRVEQMVRRMAITLSNRVKPAPWLPGSPEIFVCLWRTPSEYAGHSGYTWAGGAWERHRMIGTFHSGEKPNLTSPDYADRIYLTPVFDGRDPFSSHVLVHELGHFIGDMEGGWTIDDLGFTYEAQYRTNTSSQRLHNADAYACFIRESGFGTLPAALGAQITVDKFGSMPYVETPEQPFLSPAPSAPAKDRFAYPAGFE